MPSSGTVKVILAHELSAYCQFSKRNLDKAGDVVDDTHNLKLPYILAAQAQKHVTHNEALRALDAIVQLAVLDRDLTTPPGSPLDGDRYIVGVGATGVWVGKDSQIAAWQDGAWAFYQPNEGWLAWVTDEDVLCVSDGSTWLVASSGGDSGSGSVNPTPLVGVNATADTTNRLSVTSPASLFNHEGNGHQQKINKAAVGDTASQLYQTNFSGRAEIGLTGDDDFHFKVSPDGATFHEAIIVDKDDGSVAFPNTPVVANMLFNLFDDGGRFAGSPEDQGVSIGAFQQPGYLTPFNGMTFSAGDKFIHGNSTHGGGAGALGADVDALIQKIRSGAGGGVYRTYGPEFYVMNADAGSGTSSSLNVAGQTHYEAVLNAVPALWAKSSFIYNLKCNTGRCAINIGGALAVYLDGVLLSSPTEVLPADGWKQVVTVMDYDPLQYVGYFNNVLRLWAQPSSSLRLALPILFPGQIKPTATPIGLVPGLRAWR